PDYRPSVSLVIVARNAEKCVVKRLKNSLDLVFPSEDHEIVFFSDGSTDNTLNYAKSVHSDKIRIFSSSEHLGKNNGLNQAIKECKGDILVLSDVDVMLDKDTILTLVKHFSDPCVGGVCGGKELLKVKMDMSTSQSHHIKFEKTIKELESLTGSISSNDGTLYAIRRNLFKPLPPGVTDDLYVCLSVVKQRSRFLYEPDAKAYIEPPSKSTRHEMVRRRRIVSNSLMGLYLMRELMNPFKYGMFAIILFINKVLRRVIPFCLILVFFSNLFLSFHSTAMAVFLCLQIAFYSLAASYKLFFRKYSGLKNVKKVTALAYYFCVGNCGTLLGVLWFLKGSNMTKWEPISDGEYNSKIH
ncbi:MAG TPA: glycosyltransferase, partial [Candidatus Brocadiaceae bacterium]|nr:glycosyltransferase [Candidatus Brocadiaceae bacterium]